MAVSAYAADGRASTAFATGFVEVFGSRPALHDNPVSPTQCSALSFIRDNQHYPDFSLALSLVGQQVRSGGLLVGRIDAAGGLAVHLFIIDDEGKVGSADSYLNPQGNAVGFAVPVRRKGDASAATQLLLAIAVPPGASVDAFDLPGRSDADAFFARLRAELTASQLGVTLAVTPFEVD